MRYRLGQSPGAGTTAPLPGPAWESYFAYTAEFIPLAVTTAGARPVAVPFAQASIRIHSDSNFAIHHVTYVAEVPGTNARVSEIWTRWRDETAGRYLQRGTPLIGEVAGWGRVSVGTDGVGQLRSAVFLPAPLTPPYVIAGSSVLLVEAANVDTTSSGSPNLRITFHGVKIREGRAPWDRPYRARLPYVLRLPPDDQDPTIPANSTLSWSAPVDNEADFLVREIRGIWNLPGAAPNATMQALVTIGDASDRIWMDRPVHWENLVGSGAWPNRLPAPRFVPRGFAVFGAIQNLESVAATHRILLVGEKLYE